MIYFDNAATSYTKPEAVATEMFYALQDFGNPGRSVCGPSILASRTILRCRKAICKLVEAESPLNVAFTSGATESLNLVLQSLLTQEDHVITTTLEHNSVLRPLYSIGCPVSFIPCDESGTLVLHDLEKLVTNKTKVLVSTHASNVTGGVVNTQILYDFCKKHNLVFVLDVSQTMGAIPVRANMADILCFTGHKSLYGPQGTGGIITNNLPKVRLVKTGGSGSDSFSPSQNLSMPDIFEAGTPNTHGIAGLLAGADFVNTTGIARIQQHERDLLSYFLQELKNIPKIKIFGNENIDNHVPVVSLLVGNQPADETALALYEAAEICVRSGSHCAPLVHKHFNTVASGMVRFSFGFFNTTNEIDLALEALEKIAATQ